MNNSEHTPTANLFTNRPNEKALEFIITSNRKKFFPTLASVERVVRLEGDVRGFSGANPQEVLNTLEKMFSKPLKRFFVELGDGEFIVNVARIQRELSATFHPAAFAELSEMTINRSASSKTLFTSTGLSCKNFTELFFECMLHASLVEVNAANVLRQFLENGKTREDFAHNYNRIGATAKKVALANVEDIKPFPAVVYVSAWGALYVETIKNEGSLERLERLNLPIFCEFTSRDEAENFVREAGPHWAFQHERNRIQFRIDELERELEAEREKLANA